ncbi:MAG: hypothetical protein WC549_08020 [Actinomycetota bacterium]
MDNRKFKKVILINMGAAFLYGIIICFVLMTIFYVISRINSMSAEPGFTEGLYTVIRFGLIAGALFGFIFAVILGMLYRPFRSIVFFRDEDNFLSALNRAMDKINYELDKKYDNSYIFREKRDKLAVISVRIGDNKAIIYGHFSKVTNLKKNLSFQSPLNI